jgi:hypothetical protein
MIKKTIFFLFFIQFQVLFCQESEKINFTGDFRFRLEHDWNSKKSDGSYRSDRSRMRYRFRLGATYLYKDWGKVGARIRTGNLNDQQGPHITLGGNEGEFSTISLGFEKIYFQIDYKFLFGWIGKNSFPFYKQNELFWNDNVFPEGISLSYKKSFESSKKIDINLGHFIIKSSNSGFDKDSYMQGLQIVGHYNALIFYPSFYYFNTVPNIPDGNGDYNIEYSILNIGAKYTFFKKKYRVGFDWYKNLSLNRNIPKKISSETNGFTFNLGYGQLKENHDLTIDLTLSYLEKIAIVDYFAQNDWARWDYSSYNSSGSRLSNFKGLELKMAYKLNDKMNLVFRGFIVEEIITFGQEKENGNRVRLDFNFAF